MQDGDLRTLTFLRSFAADIMTPVDRSERVNVDYLPSQVVTEFVRDFNFDRGPIDGVAYSSTVSRTGWNVALFFGPADLGLASPTHAEESARLSFEKDVWARTR
ncbi:RES domain-containing protein [Achromobacter animicus]|uniref:RES domain-containing protein n=1 Tax=Achromobacter animicus TaxID=1389935 RepID=UPI002448007D|nr:RES domain-containing protein [Achromobacter animicus]MDH0683051.1 RES domain-containing protein [Achromobacter animicus]